MDQQRLTYLFRQWVSGSATEDERSEWLSQANLPENEAALRHLIDGYMREQKTEETLSAQSTLNLLNSVFGASNATKEQDEAPSPAIIGRSQRRIWPRMAAAVFIGLLAGAIYIINKNRTNQPIETAAARPASEKKDAAPGVDKAILTLGDGTTVTLDSNSHQVIRQSGVVLSQQGGSLVYQGEASEMTYNTLTTPKGCQFSITLPDSTRVWLNAASSLRYPVAFNGADRTVEITGEAYFEVAADKSKPFHVRTGNTAVDVLGTHFNVMAYADEEATKTTLLEGAIRVTAGETSRQVAPGQQALIKQGSSSITVSAANVEEAIAWKEGYFLFQGADLPVLLRQFARWYNISVIDKGRERSYEFVGKIPRTAHLSSILRVFEANNIPYTLENGQLTIQP
jgi:ferric-dicitrate binding protein FerR (iron transport regulator)